MLILTRNAGESIMIGDDIVITILGVNRGQVRIGIAAPIEIEVHREEIYERIQRAKDTRLMETLEEDCDVIQN